MCAYRDSAGRKCAAGALMRDDELTPLHEGCRFGARFSKTGVGSPSLTWPERLMEHGELVFRLQRVHDDAKSWESSGALRGKLAVTARDFSLDDKILQGLELKR